MGSLKRMLNVELRADDRQALARVAHAVQEPLTEVVRWAIRYYALKGPWPRLGEEQRGLVLGNDLKLSTVGPHYLPDLFLAREEAGNGKEEKAPAHRSTRAATRPTRRKGRGVARSGANPPGDG